ncbi:ABC transporter permease [Brevibacillus marinus]|uniref:ABC transporter permease n=1 Tax=Brevibacillus marinus TaxID=2496837 RepID=UPI0019D1FB08|nr:ABC transporter permease [Brevibacillus marinus]
MRSVSRKIWHKRQIGMIAGAVLVIFVLAAVTAPLWVPLSPIEMEPADRLQPPSREHWFGTDHFGRDIFSRVVYAAQVSFSVGFVVALLTTILGTVSGLLAGYYRWVDSILMRIIDGVMAFPSILLAIALVAALGGSLFNLVIALVFAFWPNMTRVVRSSTLQLSRMQFVEAAKSTGTRDVGILFLHILPNALTPIIVQATFIFADAILAEAALSFLGLGVKPPTPTWGNMLGESRIYLTTASWFSIFPGIAIMITVLALNIFGDMLRDMLDPRSARKRKQAVPAVQGAQEKPQGVSVDSQA